MRLLTPVLLLLTATTIPLLASAQDLRPASYAAVPAPSGVTPIYTSSMLERLVDVNDKQLDFTAGFLVYLSWKDPRAKPAMMQSTDAYRNASDPNAKCLTPCTTASLPSRTGTTYDPYASCCDGVWLPALAIFNSVVPRLTHVGFGGLIFGAGDEVGWYLSLHGKFFTPMDFRNFPFDSQSLQIDFGITAVEDGKNSVRFVASATSTAFLIGPGKGDTVSGWTVDGLEITTSETLLPVALEYFILEFGNESNPKEAMPIVGGNEDNPWQRNITKSGFGVRVDVTRTTDYYVVNHLAPIYVLIVVSLVTYMMHPSKVENRIGMNVTCFLALTAIKWIVNRELPASNDPTPVTLLILTSYAIFCFAVIESLVVHAMWKNVGREEKSETNDNTNTAYHARDQGEGEAKEGKKGKEGKEGKELGSSVRSLSLARVGSWHQRAHPIRILAQVKAGDAITTTALYVDFACLTLAAATIVACSIAYFTPNVGPYH